MVDRVDIEDLFAPFGKVAVKRMFSGHGVYADDLFFAMLNKGEVYLKTDEALAARLRAAGSRPFTYTHGKRGEVTTSLWTLPATAFDDDEELKDWSRLALEAARRKAAGKQVAGAPARARLAKKAAAKKRPVKTPARK